MGELSSGTVAPSRRSTQETLPLGRSAPLQPPLPTMGEVAAAAPGSLPSLAEALGAVPEHRKPRGFRADQPPVLLVPTLLELIVGVLIGRRGYGSISEWARMCERKCPEVVDALGFPAERKPRTPCGATLFRIVRRMDVAKFRQALQGWLVQTAEALQVRLPAYERGEIPEDQVALDGKTVRGASARRGGTDFDKSAVHIVAAYVPALQTVMDQLEADGKGRELAAIRMLLGRLPMKGRVYTADALATQRDICQDITKEGGDYLLPVKENQPALLADIQEAFSPSAVARP